MADDFIDITSSTKLAGKTINKDKNKGKSTIIGLIGYKKAYNFSKKIINYDPLIDTGSKKFIDTAAIIKYLDLVITTDNAIAHLAGSLGTQTWLLLPHVSDWRWFDSNEETIWYENFRIYRQKKAGDWTDVASKVKMDLDTLIDNIHEVRNPKA